MVVALNGIRKQGINVVRRPFSGFGIGRNAWCFAKEIAVARLLDFIVQEVDGLGGVHAVLQKDLSYARFFAGVDAPGHHRFRHCSAFVVLIAQWYNSEVVHSNLKVSH